MIDAYSDFFVQTCKSSIKKFQLHFHSIVCFSRRWSDQIPNKCVYDDIGWSPLNAAWATDSIMYGGADGSKVLTMSLLFTLLIFACPKYKYIR